MEKKSLALTKTLPIFKVKEGSILKAIDLRDYLNLPLSVSIIFSSLEDSDILPDGLVITPSGILTGIPAFGASRAELYKVSVVACSETEDVLKFEISIQVQIAEPKVKDDEREKTEKDLQNYWNRVAKGLSLPDLSEVLTRGISRSDIYYLLGRFGALIIWNADDLRPEGDGKLLKLKGISKHYNVYNFGVSLVATPKDLYSTARTLKDGLKTVQSMVKWLHDKNWKNLEIAGYDKLMQAVCVEIASLNLPEDKMIKVLNYELDTLIARRVLSPDMCPQKLEFVRG